MANRGMFQYLLDCKFYASCDILSRFMLEGGNNALGDWVFRSRDIDDNAVRICSYGHNTVIGLEDKL